MFMSGMIPRAVWNGQNNITRSAWLDGAADYWTDTFAATQNQTAWTLSAWVRRPENIGGGAAQYLAAAGAGSSDRMYFSWQPDDTLLVQYYSGGSVDLSSTPVWRDTEWQHIRWVWDTDNASADDRMQVYVNNDRVVFSGNPPAGLAQGFNTSGRSIDIGKLVGFSTGYFNGLMAQVAFISGDVTSLCGEYITAGTNGQIWAPLSDAAIKTIVDAGGSNSFLLSSAIGDGTDDSTNGNNVTATSMSDAANGSNDTPSSPLPVFNKLIPGGGNTFTEEGGTVGGSSDGSQANQLVVTPGFYSGQHVLEFECTNLVSAYPGIGLIDAAGMRHPGIMSIGTSNALGNSGIPGSYSYAPAGAIDHESATIDSSPASFGNTDRIAIEVDLDSDVIRWYKNGSLQSTTNTAGLEAPVFFAIDAFNNADARIITEVADMTHTPTTGYTVPQISNFEEQTVQGADVFNALPYAGDGTSIGSGGQSQTGVGFQPDLVWVKGRNTASSHRVVDTSRGVELSLQPDVNNAEITETEGLTSFDADGFTHGNVGGFGLAFNYVAWCWKVNGGTTATNNDGSITTTVQVAPEGHMSMATFTGDGTTATLGHGLSGTPDLVIIKKRSAADSWYTWFNGFSADDYLLLHTNNGIQTASTVYPSAPTSTVVNVGTAANNSGTRAMYCFRNVPGVCHVDKYGGNSNANGPFVYTGFRPRWILIKGTIANTEWHLFDTARGEFNENSKYLEADTTVTEGSTKGIDILANGFKLRTTSSDNNSSSSDYYYIAIADVGTGSNLPPIPGR
jgi:hypothetical protein